MLEEVWVCWSLSATRIDINYAWRNSLAYKLLNDCHSIWRYHVYYEQFDIVPSSLRPELAKGKVLVTNWH